MCVVDLSKYSCVEPIANFFAIASTVARDLMQKVSSFF